MERQQVDAAADERNIEAWLDLETLCDFALERATQRYRQARCWHVWRKRWRWGAAGKLLCARCYTHML